MTVKGGNKVWFPHFSGTTGTTSATGPPIRQDGDLSTFTCNGANTIFFGYSVGNSPTGDLDDTQDYADVEGSAATNFLCSPELFGLSSPSIGTKYCYCRSVN